MSWAGRRPPTFAAKPPYFSKSVFYLLFPHSLFQILKHVCPGSLGFLPVFFFFFSEDIPTHAYGCFSVADSDSAGVACFLLQSITLFLAAGCLLCFCFQILIQWSSSFKVKRNHGVRDVAQWQSAPTSMYQILALNPSISPLLAPNPCKGMNSGARLDYSLPPPLASCVTS